ncbi:response regulator transcription factor [Nocardioides sp. JQ2195]|uniref:response regulator transcription factor n=1 Tax=Nocardioides sp. JQ2195 TaxID=2592334 RepID=UPI00143E85C5|nr:response regulator transcription factor [Nocardioides sp. JQ2195]QIX25962.1 response regulator transcription factor [Nocardioides sp. JQ2195]
MVPRQRRGAHGVRLVVVSDHSLVSEAVRMALASRGFQALSLGASLGASGRRDITAQVRRFRPAVGLLLCELEDRALLRDAVDVVASTQIRWVLLTRANGGAAWGALVEAGVAAVLPMSTDLETLTDALLQVVAGRPMMPEGQRRELVEQWHREGEQARLVSRHMELLTPREMAVLASLHEGLTVKLIAVEGGVSEGTVRSQVKSILRKLEVSSQIAAVAAYRQMIELEPPPRRPRP